MSSFNLPELISDPNTLDQIARLLLKNHNEKPLSQMLTEFENELPDTNDLDNLKDMPSGKIKLDYDTIIKMTKKDKKEFLIQSEKKNLRVLAKIKEKLKHSMKKDPLENRYLTKSRELLREVKEHFTINSDNRYITNQIIDHDTELERQLKTIMNQIRSSKLKHYSQKGKKTSINRFIQSKFGSTKEIFLNKKATNQLTFNFVVDQSGSMGDDTLKVAEIIKTFYKSVSDIQEIKINVIGYESSRLNIVLNNENELNRIAYCGGGTPSCEALTYASDLIKKQTGKNVLIFMSDGSPNGIGSYFNTEKYMKYVLDDLKKYKRIDSFGILIGGYSFSKFSQIFGKNFSEFSNIENANDELTKIFKMFVDEYLRNF